ncbi:hypothetical protein C8P68_101302 [Mucilaginibacter yixingensis]|uniref:Uncharacterized protein n=1 Tax=Mucilaginibacter yixingensis TaxID=1295612 RepID=A0A2T5JF68_9SPHI|nr:hypothetical protein [Mucilaginibacter yixingensis]PTR01071.1 hypothetical protein C8P68_101302 [Mucilaginibacter yixingensis]
MASFWCLLNGAHSKGVLCVLLKQTTIAMIILLHTTLILCLILMPLASRRKKKHVLYINDHDTSDAHYAVNINGFLEKISDSADHYME